MPGGSLQLVAYGAQDLYITAKPQVTYWKTVHKRHTLFAIEPIKQEINGSVDFGKKFTIQIAKNGDLLHRIMLEVTLPDLNKLQNQLEDKNYELSYKDDIGLAIFKTIELDIGGQRLERHTSEWLDCWLSLNTPSAKQKGLEIMINGATKSQRRGLLNVGGDDMRLFIPLQFFFNRHAGQALPLVALTFHDVKLHIELRNFYDCVSIKSKNVSNVLPNSAANIAILQNLIDNYGKFTSDITLEAYADMVFLDTVERNFFATKEHEYLIEIVQYLGQEDITNIVDPNSNQKTVTKETTKRLPIPFINPVKELVWVFTRTNGKSPLEYCDIMKDMRLIINGNERFSLRSGKYFRLVQPWENHTAIPDKHIYCYSFALTPHENQPSGTCNFSKIESAYMQMTLDWSKYNEHYDEYGMPLSDLEESQSDKTSKLHVFALSYNILRIKNGLANLDYHN